MNQQQQYDFIIIGGGLSGLQLAMAFIEDGSFHSSKIAIIEPEEKLINDRSWSFWEKKGEQKWHSIIHHEWNKALVKDKNKNIELETSPYVYRTIRSADFYAYAKQKINSSSITWIKDKVTSIQDSICQGELNYYKGDSDVWQQR